MSPRFSLFLRFQPLAALCALAAISPSATAQTTWTAATNQQWGDAANWSAGVPNAPDAIANIDTAVTVAVSDTGTAGTYPYTFGRVSTSITTGSVVIGDPTFSSDILTAATTTGNPVINVPGGAALFYYANLEGTQGFEKTGAGRLTWRFNNNIETFTGPIRISGGILGFSQDSNLGPASTNGIFIANATKLLAEPGSNAGTVTLPAERTITLTGALPQLGASNAAIQLIVEGPITDGGNGFGLDKTDAGALTLAGTNSWTGPARVSAGLLTATTPAALPGFASQTYNVNGTSTLAVRFGDSSPWTAAQIGQLLANPGVIFATGAAFGIDTTGNTLDTTLTGDLPVANFSKAGSGTLVLQDPQSTIKTLVLQGGTLRLPAPATLPALTTIRGAANGATLDLGGASLSLADLQELSGGSTVITNGNLTYTGPTIVYGGNNNTTLDLSGLTSYTHATSGTELRLETGNNVTATRNTILFSKSTNTVTVPTRIIAGGGPSTSTGPHIVTASLGTTNVFNTATFQLGAFNSAGTINFQPSLTNPTFTLRGADGTSAATTLRVGETSSGSRSGAGILDFTGGSADILANEVVIGRHIAGSSNGDPSTLQFPAGTLTTSLLLIAEKTSSGTPTINASFNQTGGSVTVNTLAMVQTGPSATGTAANATQNLRAAYNLEGGTLTVAEIKPGTLIPAITGGTSSRTLKLEGGTLTTPSASDLTISGITVNVPLTSLATVDSAAGQKVIFGPGTIYQAQLNSVLPGAGLLSVDGELTLGGILSVTENDLSGGTTLPPGSLLKLIDHTDGTLTGTFDALPEGSRLTVGLNEFIIRYQDTVGGTGRFVTLTVPAAGDAFASFISGFYPTSTKPDEIGFAADPDKDGVPNAIEFITGGDPRNSPSTALLPTVSTESTTLSFTFRRTAASAYLNPRVEVDTDLQGQWTPAQNGVDGVVIQTIPDGFGPGVDRIVVTLPRSPDTRKFLRLAVNPAS